MRFLGPKKYYNLKGTFNFLDKVISKQYTHTQMYIYIFNYKI